MSLSVSVRHRFDSFEVDADFDASRGVTALFGRSGSGKTSILKMIAGLIKPQAGKITFADRTLFSSADRISIAPHKRQFGYVFQEPRLFPHLSVSQNLRYGAWVHRKSVSKIEFTRVVEMLGIAGLLDRQPHSLSGGEQQRVAIGRALLSSPQMLLMDEPLASLDQKRKAEILPFLEELCTSSHIPIIYVSHSMNEVMRLANRVVLLESGKVKSIQTPQTLTQNADFLAAMERNELGSMIEGRVKAFDQQQQIVTIGLRAGELKVSATHANPGQAVKIFIAARDVMLGTQQPEGLSAMNIFSGTVTHIDHQSLGHANVALHCAGEDILSQITAHSSTRLDLKQGMPIYAIIKAVSFEAL